MMRDIELSTIVVAASLGLGGAGVGAAYVGGNHNITFPDALFIFTATSCVVPILTLGALVVRDLLRHRFGRDDTVIEAPRRVLVSAPGSRLHTILGFVYSRKTMERVFEPALADMREEYFKALAAKQEGEARRVVLAYYWSLIKMIPLHLIVGLVKQVFELWKWFGSAV